MRKLLVVLSVISILFIVAGCGSKSTSESNDGNNESVAETQDSDEAVDNKEKESEKKKEEEPKQEDEADQNKKKEEKPKQEEDKADQNKKKELTLQVLKKDEEEGLTLENNEIYQTIQEEVASYPLMGEQGDLSLYPFDIVEFEDGTSSLMLLVINRLDKPIQNLIFNLTFGNKEGAYIFDDLQVDLPEEYLGVLEKDGIVPILVDINKEDEELFYSFDMDNVLLELDNVGIDFAE